MNIAELIEGFREQDGEVFGAAEDVAKQIAKEFWNLCDKWSIHDFDDSHRLLVRLAAHIATELGAIPNEAA
jgi:hypothetical protein